MCSLIKFTNNTNLSGYTLIIPSVSVGNVPQLTVDLIISSYNLKKIGSIWNPAIIPSVGSNPFEKNNTDICTACELYARDDLKIAVIQLRSGIENKYALNFFEELKCSIINLNFKNVILLASSFAHEMHNISSSKYRYLSNDISDNTFQQHDVLPCEEKEGEGIFHGSGFAEKLYSIISKVTKCTLIMKYTSEGDNRPDAIHLLDLLHKLIRNFKVQQLETVVFPISWDHVFGNPPPIGIY